MIDDLIIIPISLYTVLLGVGIVLIRKDISELKELIDQLNNK